MPRIGSPNTIDEVQIEGTIEVAKILTTDELLEKILIQLKINNMQLSLITKEEIIELDVIEEEVDL